MSDDTNLKAGRKISAARLERLKRAMAHATEMQALITEILSEQAELDAEPAEPAAKAGEVLDSDAGDPRIVTAKALGDRTLELRVAWGYDGHKEQFHPERTDFDLEHFPTPPVLYYHGYKADGKKAPKPIYIGKTLKRENRSDGHYLTVKLNNKPEADRMWDASLKGEGFVSPGTIGHLIRKDADGTLTYWPIAEISGWDGSPQRKQAHPASLAFPVLKALYAEAGLNLPTTIAPPEVSGDDTSADSIDPETARQILANEIKAGLLSLRGTRT